MTASKAIFGFTGLLASGKGTAAKYLEERYRASQYRFSSVLRDILRRLHLEQTRDHLVKTSECVRATFGDDILARAIAKDAEIDDNLLVVVDGVRRLADITYLKKLPNFILVEISAEPKTRYERLILRGENPDDRGKTYEQFLADHERSTEKSILEVLPLAKEKIDNNGALVEFHKKLDALVKKYAN